MPRLPSLARWTGLALASSLLASALPALAAQGAPTSIRLLDDDRDGRIDRAVVTVDNPSQRSWRMNGASGFKAWYGNAEIALKDAFVASAPSANPVSLEVVFDQGDSDLPIDTSAAHIELEYVPQGLGKGADDGFSELATIVKGDSVPADTEIDAAGPILTASDPAHASIEVDRDHVIGLAFSEPIEPSSLAFTSVSDAAGWAASWSADGKTASLTHVNYGANDLVNFTVTAAKDAAGNALAAGTRVPNPFRFRNSSTSTSQPRPDTSFELFLPKADGVLPSGVPTHVAWTSTLPEVEIVRLSVSVGGGAYALAFQGPVGSDPFVWYPPAGSVTLKLEGLTANGAVSAVDARGPLTFAKDPSPPALRVVSPGEVVSVSGASAELRYKTDLKPDVLITRCGANDPAITGKIEGHRPTTVTVRLDQLVPGASYACYADVIDHNGNTVRVDFPAVSASGASAPAAPAIIDGPSIDRFDPVAKTARLRWTTNEPTTSSVSYGKLNDYSGLATESVAATAHELVLSNLQPGGTHQLRITSIDADGNAAVSPDYGFVFLSEGARIKGAGPAVYWYLGGKRYVFPNEAVYASWFGGFEGVVTVTASQLAGIPIGGNVQLKAGAWMVKITSDPKVYAVEPGGALRWIQSEAQARALYGADWAKKVRDLDVSLFVDYRIGEPLGPDETPKPATKEVRPGVFAP